MSFPFPTTSARSGGVRSVARRFLPAAIAAAAVVGTAACGGDDAAEDEAQPAVSDTAAPTQTPGSSSMPAGMQELQQVQQQLSQIRQQAMQDSELQTMQSELQQDIEQAMRDTDPQTAQRMDRFDSLRQQFQTAQSGGDTARLRSLFTELQGLQRSLQQTQSQVLEREDIADRVEAFREAVLEQMREVDSATDSLMSLADSLSQQMQGGGAGLMPPGDTAGQ